MHCPDIPTVRNQGKPPRIPSLAGNLIFLNVQNISSLTDIFQVFEWQHEQKILQAVEVSTVGLPPPYFEGGAEKAVDG
ncbi:MAG: hypothetical protein JJT96_09905 [Opitutales bacterium]|nr:hypothetical protein [Opitutales bacterium]